MVCSNALRRAARLPAWRLTIAKIYGRPTRFLWNSELGHFKLDVVAELAPFATSVLLDPEVSAAQAIAEGKLPGDKALVVAVESTGYTGDPAARRGQVLPGWSVEKAKRMGASMVKLLVYYHP